MQLALLFQLHILQKMLFSEKELNAKIGVNTKQKSLVFYLLFNFSFVSVNNFFNVHQLKRDYALNLSILFSAA